MKKIILPLVLLVASLALSVVSYLLLPDIVTTQLSLSGGSATTMPKLFAVALPGLLGVGGALACLLGRGETKKPLLVSCVGILVFVVMLVVNL